MGSLRGVAAATAPAAILVLFATWCGNLVSGTEAPATLVAHLVLVAVVATIGERWGDPLRLGRSGRLLVVALWLSLLASTLSSPVPRAGRVALVLAPAFVFLAAATARWWTAEDRLRVGLGALALGVGGVSAWGLLASAAGSGSAVALPLGHHNLTAAWSVALLPMVALGWRYGVVWRILAATATLLVIAALLGTGSLAGVTALAVVIGAALLTTPRRPRWVLPLAVTVVLAIFVAAAPRLLRILAGEDPSALARAAYLRAGVAGLAERPVLGWGPGSVAWTVARFLEPVPAVHPPGEVVGDLHSLPLHLLYELGGSGGVLIIGLIAVFFRRRWAELDADADHGLARASLLGLLGLAVCSLGGLPLNILALPTVAAALSGALLAATHPASAALITHGVIRRLVVPSILALLMASLLLRVDLAHLAYDHAIDADEEPARLAFLERAHRLDPSFPLYAARLAWSRDEPSAAARAASSADALSALWLAAGAEALAQGDLAQAQGALLVACDLDPLSGTAPFLLTLTPAPTDAAGHQREEWAGRAVLGDPRWLAAAHWLADDLAGVAGQRVEHLAGVPIAWRASAVDAARRVMEAPVSGDFVSLALGVDQRPAESVSIYAFRRRPWPQDLVVVPLRAELLAVVSAFPGAAATPGTKPWVFAEPGCGLPRGRVAEDPAPVR